jgi:hypothetical protein
MDVVRRSGKWGSRMLASTLLLVAAAQVRCGGSEDTGFTDGQGKDPCTTVYAGQCGTACSADAECAAGLHCDGASCTAQCGPQASLCAAEQSCSADGRCMGGSSSGASGGTIGIDLDGSAPSGGDPGTGQGGSGEPCAEIELELGDVTPTVVLLIDQSGSMELADIEPGGPTRWDALKMALTGAGSVIESLEGKVRFGFAFYSNDAQLNEPPEPGVCPILDKGGMDETLMPPALDRFEAFAEYFAPLPTYRNTPTGESFQLIADELAAFDEPGPKYVVLATDGNPDRCEDDREGVGTESKEMVVTNVGNAYDELDITTFVISVGDDVAAEHLNDVANVGQGFPADDTEDRFYLVTTQDSLADAFEEIVSGVRSCTLTLNGEIDPEQADQGQVLLDGEPLDMSEEDGWVVIDGETIELVGSACEAIESGEHKLSARFPCDAVVTPPIPK